MAKTEQQHKEHHDVVNKQLEEKQKLRDEAREEAEAQAKVSTPTPTQREMDLVRLGVKVELADDGSGPDLVEVTSKAPDVVKSVAPAATPASYATRTVVAGGPGPSHPPQHPHAHARKDDDDEKKSDKK